MEVAQKECQKDNTDYTRKSENLIVQQFECSGQYCDQNQELEDIHQIKTDVNENNFDSFLIYKKQLILKRSIERQLLSCLVSSINDQFDYNGIIKYEIIDTCQQNICLLYFFESIQCIDIDLETISQLKQQFNAYSQEFFQLIKKSIFEYQQRSSIQSVCQNFRLNLKNKINSSLNYNQRKYNQLRVRTP